MKIAAMEQSQELPNDFEDAIIVFTLSNSPEICLINFSDFERCSKHNWQLRKGAIQTTMLSKGISLSRFIFGKNTDHVDRNILNNCRSNFRTATKLQQNCNRNKHKGDKTSKFKGVYYHSRTNKWMARVAFNYKRVYLGLFNSEIEAANAYNVKAAELHGKFAALNVL